MKPIKSKSLEPLGPKIRRQRRRLGLTLNELAARASISKPYLSLIETGRVANPPSDEKLRRLEQTLGFSEGELLMQAHLERTPHDVRVLLQKLLHQNHSNAAETSGAIDLTQAFISGILEELAGQVSQRRPAAPVIDGVAAAALCCKNHRIGKRVAPVSSRRSMSEAGREEHADFRSQADRKLKTVFDPEAQTRREN